MADTVFTHDRIDISQAGGTHGVLAQLGVLWGGNALQNITVARHTPHNPQQAVGYLGIVDYTSGEVTSDLTLDCILTEESIKASAGSSAYKKAGVQLTLGGAQEYLLISAAIAFAAGQPATVNYGYITPGLASYFLIQDQPTPTDGEESAFAIVMGDDGSGLFLQADYPVGVTVGDVTTIPVITPSGRSTVADGGIPAGISTLNMNATINRDHIMDIRSSTAIQYVTTYPIDINGDMNVYRLPVADGSNVPGAGGYDPDTFTHLLRVLKNLTVMVPNPALGNHVGTIPFAQAGDIYAKGLGFKLLNETEAVQVGRYLNYTMNFRLADLWIPVDAVS